MDEARFGLIVLDKAAPSGPVRNWHKRRYCPSGVRPPCTVQRKYEWTWFYAAVEPMTGDSFSLYLPRLDGDCYKVFLRELSQTYPDDFILLITDNAPAHRKHDLELPDNIIPLALPPYSPELNPAERWFLEFRRTLANRCFDSIDALHDALSQVLEPFTSDKERLELLTNFPWWHFGVSQLDVT